MWLSKALRINQQPAPPDAPQREIHLVGGIYSAASEIFVKAYAKLTETA